MNIKWINIIEPFSLQREQIIYMRQISLHEGKPTTVQKKIFIRIYTDVKQIVYKINKLFHTPTNKSTVQIN